MDLSIIIPSFNTKDLLDQCLASIERSLKGVSLTYEIIVVDNASTDGSIQLLNTKYKRVIKILNDKNIGYGKANNLGIQKAKGKFLLLLNSDIEVLDSAIPKLYAFGLDKPKAFVGGKLLNRDKTPQASCGPFYTLPVIAVMLFLKGDAFGITRSSPNQTTYTDWVSGACLFASKQAFVDVGLFDESIFMYMEEIDLLYRARKKGYGTFFYPDAEFIHVGAASSGSKKQPVLNIYRGLLYFYRKHRSIIEQVLLRVFLWKKAMLGIIVGKLTGNKYLLSTYEEAIHLV